MNKNFFKYIVITICIIGGLSILYGCRENSQPVTTATIQKKYIRKNAHSETANKDLQSLEKAIKIMRLKDCNDPCSWYYQSAIHWIPDTIKTNNLCSSYNTVVDLKDGWDNCTHTPSGAEKIHFLVWHRLYIYHFEKIIRRISGDSTFALPYWDYTDVGGNYRTLPNIFRNRKSSLYESCRFDSLNNGYDIAGPISRALDLDKLMSYTSFRMFSTNINVAPHGAIHDYIGHGNNPEGKRFKNPITGTITEDGLMGQVPTAAFDPIFWLHHSNIDRIWQKWTNSDNGEMVTLEELKNISWKYTFFDENGNKVIYSPEQIMKIIYNMDYEFDDTPIAPKETGGRLLGKYPKKAILTVNNINSLLKNKVHNIPFVINPNATINTKQIVKCTIRVSYKTPPKGVYEVYVNIPSEQMPRPTLKSFVGYMTFFGASHHGMISKYTCDCCREKGNNNKFLLEFEYEFFYDFSTNKPITFTIYKQDGIHYGNPTIENISINY